MPFSQCQVEGSLGLLGWSASSDPYPVAWVITGLYLFSALMCVWCAVCRRKLITGPTYWRFGLFWLLVGLCLLVLGLNKQLDLHVVMMDVSRPILDDRGWYETREDWLPFVVAGIAGFGLIFVVAAVLLMRGFWSRVWLVVLGSAVLCFFVFERSFSIWVKKLPMEEDVLPGVQVNHLIELVGIALVITGAWLNLKPRWAWKKERANDAH